MLFSIFPGEPYAELIKSFIFNSSSLFKIDLSKLFFIKISSCLFEKDLNLISWHLEIIVSTSELNLEVKRINRPLVGSSSVFKRQLEADSFKSSASTINTIFFSDSIDFLARKFFIFLICSILIVSFLFFEDSFPERFTRLPFEKYVGSINKKSA